MGEILEQFKELYQVAPKVHQLKELSSEEYKIFKLKIGLPVAVFSAKVHLTHIPSYDIYDFYEESGLVWLVPLDLPNGEIFAFVLRAFNKSAYRIYEERKVQKVQALAGWGAFKNFNRQPLVLTEGTKDVYAIQTQYPYVLGACTSGVGDRCLKVLCTLTDRFVLAYDNDKSGKASNKRARRFLEREGKQVFEAIPPVVKDWASCYANPILKGMIEKEFAWLKEISDEKHSELTRVKV